MHPYRSNCFVFKLLIFLGLGILVFVRPRDLVVVQPINA